MHSIERELIKVTGYKVQRKFSDRQDYLKSIFNAATKLTDAEFDDLTDEAASWVNDCVQAYNTKRDAELPDFDEVTGEESEGDDEEAGGQENDEAPEASDDADGSGAPDSGNEEDEGDPEPVEEPEPKVRKTRGDKKAKAAKAAKPEKVQVPKPVKDKAKPPTDTMASDEDAALDKWGCLVGSKNGMALALFEKGATTREVKEKVGGTYYNILGKLEQRGHKVEKEGNLIKITHKDELGKVSSRKPKK